MRRRGVTILELVIVIALLGIVSFVLFPPMKEQFMKARDGRRKSDLDLIYKNLADYYDTKGCYPKDLNICQESLELGGRVYLAEIPCDPGSRASYRYLSDGNDCSQTFEIYSSLERQSDPSIDRVGCRGGCGPECKYNYGVSSPNKTLTKCGPPPIFFACSPGGGAAGLCEQFDDPTKSQCPVIFENDASCQGACSNRDNRCKNSSGKHVPDH